MPQSMPTLSLTDSLIALKSQYERSLTEASTKASHLREQLSHVNALLLNQLLPSNGVAPQLAHGAADVPVVEAMLTLQESALATAQSLAASPAASAQAKGSGRKPKAQTTKAETAIAPVETEPATDSVLAAVAKKRNSLTILPAFEGVTKLDAIATVLGQNLGEVLHQDAIIQMLFGDLSLEDLKKERVRMDTLLRNGVKNSKWKKAPVPASYVLEATAAGAKPKRPGRKPDPTKEPKPKPQPEPVAEVEAAKAQAKAAKLKPGRKPTVGKAKASQKVARSKKTELELVALLRKADIQV
jgi:hypothetical protein